MKTERKMLIAAILVAIILLNCLLPVLKVSASTDVKVTLEKNLYTALKENLSNRGINAVYIDEQRTIIIGDEEIAKVTELTLSNSDLTDLTGLEIFTNLSTLDLSSNRLNKDSNLAVLSSLNLSLLDLSSNEIEDVSMITNLNNIQTVNLHNQKFDVVEIIELDTTNTSSQTTQVTFALPQIVTQAGYLRTEWLIEETSGEPYINWSRFDHKNIKVEVARKSGANYNPYKSMVTLRINISDPTNMLYNSDINMFFIVVDSDERGIYIKDANMYKAIKQQLTKNQKVNSELISYYRTTPDTSIRNLYERAFDEPQVLVITANDIINKIPSLILANKKIKELDGLEKFVGLETELDLSGNYIKSIDKLIELQENQKTEEEGLKSRLKQKLSLIADTVSKISSINASIESQYSSIESLLEQKAKLEAEIQKLEAELATLNGKKEDLETEKEEVSEEVTILQQEIEVLEQELEQANSEISNLNQELNDVVAQEKVLEEELTVLKDELSALQNSGETSSEVIQIQNEIAQKQEEIDVVNEDIEQKEAEIQGKQVEIETKIEEINQKQVEIDEKLATIATYEEEIITIEAQILEKEEQQLAAQEQIDATSWVEMYTTEEQMEEFAQAAVQVIVTVGETEQLQESDIEELRTTYTDSMREQIVNYYNPINTQLENIAQDIIDSEKSEEDILEKIQALEDVIPVMIASASEETKIVLTIGLLDENGNVKEEKDVPINGEDLFAEVITDLNQKLSDLPAFETKVLELKREVDTELSAEITALRAEVEQLQAEIDALRAEIESADNGLSVQKENLETEKQTLETEQSVLEEEKTALEQQLSNLESELAILEEELENASSAEDSQLQEEILAKQEEIATKESEIEVLQQEIENKESEIANYQTRVEEIEAEIKEKQDAIAAEESNTTEDETVIEEKEEEIANKIEEIAKKVEEINTQEESIAEAEIKIIELLDEKSRLEEILFNRMSTVYEIYNKVYKLASFATSELKMITEYELQNITYEKAKAMFNNQVAKIGSIEEVLTGFEKAYLIDKYDIPTVYTTTVEKTIQNEDGTTSKVEETVTEEIENPIHKFFTDLKDEEEEWSISNYNYYLYEFRTDDVYFSMAAHCYFARLFDGLTTCEADKYVDAEIERLEAVGASTSYLVEAKNNYSSIIEQYQYSCSDVATSGSLFNYAARMAKYASDADVYVKLPRLRVVNINENLIENIDRLSELTELVEFYAYDNEIVDISTVDWASMTKLKYLDLGFNGISDIEPLIALRNIEGLSLKANLISGSFEFDISQLTELRYLDLSENRIDDIEKLIKYLAFEARAYGYDDIAGFLNDGYVLDVRFNNQILSMKVDEKLEVGKQVKIDLPKIFRQIEEIDYANTSFGINSIYGNVTNDGKQVILDTTREGNFNAVVTIEGPYDRIELNSGRVSMNASVGAGTSCTIEYTVGTVAPIEVTVTPEEVDAVVGKTQQFTAQVTGDNVSYTKVRWEIEGATSEATTISEDGLLTIGYDETAEEIIIRAISMYDETKLKEIKVGIIQKYVTDVTITPETATINPGQSIEFTANVEGNNLEEADKEIEWDVLVENIVNENGEEVPPSSAEGTSATYKDNKLTLKVGAEEKIDKFTIVAKSKFDETKYAEAIVTVTTSPVQVSTGYQIEEEYIVGVKTKTPVEDFQEIFTTDYTVVVKEDGTEVTTGYMKTGMFVELRDENNNTAKDENGDLLVYEVVVNGDVNGDGVADSIDSNLIKAIRNEVGSILEIQKRAADIDNNGVIDILDSKLLLYHRAEVKNYCLDYVK